MHNIFTFSSFLEFSRMFRKNTKNKLPWMKYYIRFLLRQPRYLTYKLEFRYKFWWIFNLFTILWNFSKRKRPFLIEYHLHVLPGWANVITMRTSCVIMLFSGVKPILLNTISFYTIYPVATKLCRNYYWPLEITYVNFKKSSCQKSEGLLSVKP